MGQRLLAKVAHSASPWEWRRPAFFLYVIGLTAVASTVVLVPMLAWQSWARLIGGLGGLSLALLYYLPALLRSLRRRRVEHLERTDIDIH